MKSPSERFLLQLLAAVQFTHIMDFMIMMPLGQQLMREWGIGPAQFSHLVSVYTIVAGIAGFVMAPFVDRHDRRTMVLVFYAGFALGTLACALAHSPGALLLARAICGLFGGVAGTAVMSIVGDIVPPARRGAAMGIIMTAFSAAAAVGVPCGLYLAQRFTWEAPFFLLAGLAAVNWILLWRYLPPVRGHLEGDHVPGLGRFVALLRNPNAGWGLLFMATLVFGHFAIIPLLTPHLVGNLGLSDKLIPVVYLVGGGLSAFTGPWIGRLADSHGRVRVFSILVFAACAVTLGIALPPALPAFAIIAVSGSYFVVASGRFVPGQAILSLAVTRHDRGAYMSLSSCVRDLAAGISSSLGGTLVVKSADGRLQHYDILGWIAVASAFLTLWLVRRVKPVE